MSQISLGWDALFYWQLYNMVSGPIMQLVLIVIMHIKQQIFTSIVVRAPYLIDYQACVYAILKLNPSIGKVCGKNATPDIIPGTYLFWYKRAPILCTITRTTSVNQPAEGTSSLELFGFANVRTFYEAAIATVNTVNLTTNYIVTNGTRTYPGTSKPMERRPFDTVAIDPNHLQAIKQAYACYVDPPEIYKRLYIPNTLTILISGPPGVGKSSIISAIADMASMNMSICALSDLTDASIHTVNDAVNKSIVIFEDVDCMKSREEADTSSKKHVSMSALLNFLQGSSSTKGQFVIMTTNYPEKLDDALIRSERVNLHIRIESTPSLCAQMFDIYYRTTAPPTFLQDCERLKMTPADLQSRLRRHKTPEPLLHELASKDKMEKYVPRLAMPPTTLPVYIGMDDEFNEMLELHDLKVNQANANGQDPSKIDMYGGPLTAVRDDTYVPEPQAIYRVS
jgi:ATPase family associated with various cellular activities (AAA)